MITHQTINEQDVRRTSITIQEESDVLLRAQAQDVQAFTILYRLHLSSVYATCLRMLANEEEAKEVTQEAIIRAWEKIRSFRGECPFSAWIHRIAVNTTLDHLRAQQRHSSHLIMSDDPGRYETEHDTTSPEQRIDLEEAISLLPAQARTVLVMHDIEGYRHEEIAELLGIAAGTSKAHLHHARLLLKEMIQR